MCMGAIYWARLSGYYFACTRTDASDAGFDDAFLYDQLRLSPEERSLPGHCVAADDRLTPFIEWARSTQRIRC